MEARLQNLFTDIVSVRLVSSSVPRIEMETDVCCLPAEQFFTLEDTVRESAVSFLVFGESELLEKAFLVGASDFMKEPWEPKECFYRTLPFINATRIAAMDGFITLGLGSLFYKGRSIKLCRDEYVILRLLIRNRKQAISRQTLLFEMGSELEVEKTRIIDVRISSLRKKLRTITGSRTIPRIDSVSGVGYILIG